MSEPKIHHFVPRFYLRRFANAKDQVAVRARDGGAFTTSTRNVMARMGLYRVPRKKLTAEFTLGGLEDQSKAVVDQICSQGDLPWPGSDGRRCLALFMALQLNRSPDTALRLEFARDVVEEFGSTSVSEDEMRRYLRDHVLGFPPRQPEVSAACDFVNFAASRTDFPDRDALAELRIQLMFDLSVKHVAPHLEARLWSLEVSRREDLITSDRPVTLWQPESGEDRYRGVGLMDALEVWFPLDPTRMLVLRKSGPERIRHIGPERVTLVNQHIARHCTNRIVFHPTTERAGLIPLAHRRPTMRFWEGPVFDGQSGAPLPGEVIHFWSPLRDIPDGVIDPYAH